MFPKEQREEEDEIDNKNLHCYHFFLGANHLDAITHTLWSDPIQQSFSEFHVGDVYFYCSVFKKIATVLCTQMKEAFPGLCVAVFISTLSFLQLTTIAFVTGIVLSFSNCTCGHRGKHPHKKMNTSTHVEVSFGRRAGLQQLCEIIQTSKNHIRECYNMHRHVLILNIHTTASGIYVYILLLPS